jgi:2-polyprenyl-3-methyl-5-hydroxy-6-metoxy-1,4-benzoquinol methylase
MNKSILTKYLKSPFSRNDIIIKYCSGKAVLDIGCVNHNIDNVDNPNWLHKKIKNVASSVIGLDILQNEIEVMKNNGYDVICADICKPLIIDKKFDVIVIGNLIEHLSNFEGLLNNLTNLLSEDGYILISTANPFYIDQYFYSAFKNDIIVNSEHTCWIDPYTLNELISRFGFETNSVYWIKEKWHLNWVIMNGSRYKFNIMTNQWSFNKKFNYFEKILIFIIKPFFKYLFPKKYLKFYNSNLYSNTPNRFIVLRLYSKIFYIFWLIYKFIIPTSSINRHELYFQSISFKKK